MKVYYESDQTLTSVPTASDFGSTFNFQLSSFIFQLEYYLCAAGDFACRFTYFDIVLVGIEFLVHKDAEVFTVEALKTVTNLDTVDGVGTEDVEGLLVEHVLNVFDTIEMTVVVDVAVEGHKLTRGLGSLHTDTAHALYGAGFVATVSGQFTIIEGGEVGRLACLHIDECPDRAGMAKDATIVTEHAEVTRGKETVDTLYPGLYVVGVALIGVFVNLDGEAREHPCLSIGTEAFLAETTFVGVVAGGNQHLVSEEAE